MKLGLKPPNLSVAKLVTENRGTNLAIMRKRLVYFTLRTWLDAFLHVVRLSYIRIH